MDFYFADDDPGKLRPIPVAPCLWIVYRRNPGCAMEIVDSVWSTERGASDHVDYLNLHDEACDWAWSQVIWVDEPRGAP